MLKKFAEKIINSMVDEYGRCGERGLTRKQFNILSQCLLQAHETEVVGRWIGDSTTRNFTSTDYTGRIGKYHVTINEYFHFNPRYTVKSIERVYDESEEDLEKAERELLANIDWHYEVDERIDNAYVKLVYMKFVGYGEYGERWLYKFTDDNSMFVWFAAYKDIEAGMHFKLSGTVKALDEFNGVKQTVITRGRLDV